MYDTHGDDPWAAAISAWNQLSDSQRNVAIGWIASRDPALVAEAADAASAEAVTLALAEARRG